MKNKLLIIVLCIAILFMIGGCSANKKSEIKMIIQAIDDNDLELVDELSKNNKNIINKRPYSFNFYATVTEQTNLPPLHYACFKNKYDAVQILIKNGADVNLIIDEYSPMLYSTLAHHATEYKEIIFLLIDSGANVSYKNKNNHSIIDNVVFDKVIEDSKKLDEYQAQYDIFRKVIEIDSTLAYKNLIDYDLLDSKGKWNFLHKASYHNNYLIVEYLIEYLDFDINARDSDSETSLMIAAKKNNYEVVNVLIQNGANKILTNKDGKTAYDLANELNCENVLELLK